mgnify:CR=1 FL=1
MALTQSMGIRAMGPGYSPIETTQKTRSTMRDTETATDASRSLALSHGEMAATMEPKANSQIRARVSK